MKVQFELPKATEIMFNELTSSDSMFYGSTHRQIYMAAVKMAYEKMLRDDSDSSDDTELTSNETVSSVATPPVRISHPVTAEENAAFDAELDAIVDQA